MWQQSATRNGLHIQFYMVYMTLSQICNSAHKEAEWDVAIFLQTLE